MELDGGDGISGNFGGAIGAAAAAGRHRVGQRLAVRDVAERQAARKARNFARSDEIRNELASAGIILEDTKDGVRWKRR
ncbi:MAG: CysS/YqeB C-terminal domain-containing protein [Terriglobales bacterium]